jgi:hypothetical protein
VRWQIAQRGIGFESQVHDSTANLGTIATLAKEERFLAQTDTFAAAKMKEKAAVCFGRNDKFCGGADDKICGGADDWFVEMLRNWRSDRLATAGRRQ